ncbi:phytanoyl-CoA dioxygenase family protein [Pseudomonas cichorii]|uniref:phytanoyl-CoA dioxygenase family protein n=1 Tax=Pseudomonas cichorii TaxID=36746 RepID=UPI0018E5C96E|nr:phytanoyl-CoA dioxygenase family protein [Pseudomonas cichorii]MBI6853479.1 phytanoyl-CoA dioxygenase family protein [Pseudomonas cichorii]
MSSYSDIKQQGFTVLRQSLTADELKHLDDTCKQLLVVGREVLARRYHEPDMAAIRERNENVPVVVGESSNPLEVCRIEWLTGSTPYIQDHLSNRLQQVISDIAQGPFHLFKDKCNFKHPGGGAFGVHQDIAAYRHFDTNYHITAAIALDPATLENGCLEVAPKYLEQHDAQDVEQILETPMGPRPLFNYHRGGDRNGDIETATSCKFEWQPITAQAGDVILFDSYVPHRSARNDSAADRRMLFFTFAAGLAHKDLYDTYYASKRNDPNNPIFHISTPTRHR